MKTRYPYFILPFVLWIGFMLVMEGCKHEPVCPPGLPCPPNDSIINPVDTTGNDTIPTDTSGNTDPDTTLTGNPCDPDTVYFSQDVLPILISNCGMSGCHDAASAQDGVILTSYANVISTTEIKVNDPNDSEIIEEITETDPDKIMPPPPRTPLSTAQIALIRKWISQGAQDLTCGVDTLVGSGCDTVGVSFSGEIKPVLTTYCVGCHSGGSPAGGIDLSTHASVQGAAVSGLLYGAVAHLPGYKAMPQGGQKLSACRIAKIKAWVDEGALDN